MGREFTVKTRDSRVPVRDALTVYFDRAQNRAPRAFSLCLCFILEFRPPFLSLYLSRSLSLSFIPFGKFDDD